MEVLRQHGEERSAAVGDVLFEVGDERYPLIAILEGEAVILDAAGEEIIRHGAFGFLGELNLLSGQTVYLTAVVTAPMRYIAVEREALRPLLSEEGSLSDLLLSTFIARREVLQGRHGVGVEIVGPRTAPATREIVEYVRGARLPHTFRDTHGGDDEEARKLVAGLADDQLPLVRLRAAPSFSDPTRARSGAGSASASSCRRARRSTCSSVGGGPAGLGAAVYGASEGLDTLVVEGDRARRAGRLVAADREQPRLSRRHRGRELTTRAVSQARKFQARLATPYRAVGLEPGGERHVVLLDDDRQVAARAVVLATARRTGASRSPDSTRTRAPASSTPPARPRRSCARRRVSWWSAAATPRRRRRSGSPAAARS
jgi:thioredoxin reductase (NADPH)